MGRNPKGDEPMTRAEILAAYRQRVERDGGKRLIVDLEREGADALAAIKDRELGEDGGELTNKEAVTRALVSYARKGSRSRR